MKVKRKKMQMLCGVIMLSVVAAVALLFTFYEQRYFDDVLATADRIGALQTIPYEEYWNERIAADKEDEKNGYPSRLSYPGHRMSGAISIMGRKHSLDINKFGPSTRAFMEKWKSALDRDRSVRERRVQEIGRLHGVLQKKKSRLGEKKFENLCSNVVKRARLSTRETELLLNGK